jgi:hypothetical protein
LKTTATSAQHIQSKSTVIKLTKGVCLQDNLSVEHKFSNPKNLIFESPLSAAASFPKLYNYESVKYWQFTRGCRSHNLTLPKA